ncbi:MAG TPA: PAAR-like domain-containing protein [Archangium sp.]|nr:PAAR-like domain-containing protein [Archangium sp.]
MSTVFANNRSIVHKGDGQTQLCTLPDVCKTPSPGGPVPVPYVNAARDGDLSDGSSSVTIEGNPIALDSANLSTSSGDEGGTAGGGLISGKIKGKLKWGSSSLDVKVEGKGVVRFLDVTLHNGNGFNASLVNTGEPTAPSGWTYGDDLPECPECKQPVDPSHQIQEHQATQHSKDWANILTQALITAGAGTKGGAEGGGYMLGVLYCRDSTKYAATSGRSPGPFKDVALSSGFIVLSEQLRNANKDGRGGNIITRRSRPKPVEHRFATIDGGNPALMCAAPKLLQMAMRDGKEPCCMTEQWVDWDSGKPAANATSAKVEDVPGAEDYKNLYGKAPEYTHGKTVPSCKTCRDTVPRMICPP